jgi:hypothetical protein
MSKKLKIKFILANIFNIIGMTTLLYTMINHSNIGEELTSYLSGFSFGIIVVGIVFLFRTIRAMRNPKIAEKMNILENDERLEHILNKSMANTFKATMLIEALVSLFCAITNNMQIAGILGGVIWLQIVVYLIFYIIVSRKN